MLVFHLAVICWSNSSADLVYLYHMDSAQTTSCRNIIIKIDSPAQTKATTRSLPVGRGGNDLAMGFGISLVDIGGR